MKKITLLSLTAILFIGIFVTSSVTSCKKSDSTVVVPTLYDSLGGTAKVTDPANPTMMIEKGRLGLRSVVDSTIFVIAADPQLNGFFTVLLAEVTTGNLSGFQELSKNLTDFFSVATGAKNFSYMGDNMRDAHDPAKNPRMNGKASNANFDRFIADLVKGAQKNGLSNELIMKVGALVETLRPQVVQL